MTGELNMKSLKFLVTTIASLLFFLNLAQAELPASRVTIIYDAFGKPSDLERGWGYSALVEYAGKRILFDTGGQYKAFINNTRLLHIDLKKLDFVVISHRHGDHTSGLSYVIQQNPMVKIYAPLEVGSFGTPVNGKGPFGQAIQRTVENIPADLIYFDGRPSDKYVIDSPWPDANFTLVDKPLEVMPGIFLFRTVSEKKGTLELNELSMAIKTPKGMVVVVGCSHPGIETILAQARQIEPKIYTIVGGLHLLDSPDQQVTEIVGNLKNRWMIERVAAGHCTGEFAQVEFDKVFGSHHDHSGLGEVIELPN
jgi:7,8-dihydropterin-6-yl-methyl-4-(beta-D-ribofuranosyl)aminobenzene 5'-phosphate synthase